MDPQEDPPPPATSPDEEARASAGTPTQNLRNKVTYYEKVWSSGQKRSADDETDHAFSIDVNAFEKRLKEERERRTHEQSPRIDVRLRSTPQPSPRQSNQPTNIRVNIRHHVDPAAGAPLPLSDTYEERVERVVEGGEVKSHSRVLKFEKIVVKKSVREVNVTSTTTSTGTSPVMRTIEFSETMRHTPSDERIAEDSAYHSHRSRIISSASSKSSSNTSLHGNFTSEENVFSRRTPSRERLHENEQQHFWSSGGAGAGAMAYPTGGVTVSTVAGSNPITRRHLGSERHASESDNASPDWYNEYRAHSFQTVTPRMEFKRSNSQYDSHIKQIRGIQSFNLINLYNALNGSTPVVPRPNDAKCEKPETKT